MHKSVANIWFSNNQSNYLCNPSNNLTLLAMGISQKFNRLILSTVQKHYAQFFEHNSHMSAWFPPVTQCFKRRTVWYVSVSKSIHKKWAIKISYCAIMNQHFVLSVAHKAESKCEFIMHILYYWSMQKGTCWAEMTSSSENLALYIALRSEWVGQSVGWSVQSVSKSLKLAS